MIFTDISPSRMPRIVNCPGSVNLCKKFPGLIEDDTEVARKGTLAHWLAEKKLSEGFSPCQYHNQHPINDQIVDHEMIVHVLDYCEIVEKIGVGHVEQRVEITGGEFFGFGGTPDFISHDPTSCTLVIIDLKYGFIPVSPIKNWQLLSYIWLLYKAFPNLRIAHVKMEIYQPRAFTKEGIDKIWEVPFSEVQGIYFPKIEESLRSCQSKYSTTRAGDHCHYCPAMLQCDTNLQTCLKIVNLGNVQHGQEPTGEQLSNQLKLFRFATVILKKRLQVIESMVEHRLNSGKLVPGYHLEYSNGNRYIDVSDSRLERAGWPKQPNKFMTPRQAEIDGFSQELINRYTKIKKSVKLTEFDIEKVREILNNEQRN